MTPIVRNILAVILGFVAGNLVNLALIGLGGSLIPPPSGTDMSTAEGLRAAMSRLEPRHFLFPFLAHSLGTLAGAFIAALIAASRKKLLALLIGGLFLTFGILMVSMVGGPVWFVVCDLVLAYLPMAWLGGQLGSKLSVRT